MVRGPLRSLNRRRTVAPWFLFSSRRRHTRFDCDWSSDVCSSDLILDALHGGVLRDEERFGVQISRPLPVDFHGLTLAWSEGHDLASIAQRGRIQEGDLVGALQKTLDLIGQMRGAALQGPLGTGLVPLLDEADGLLRRGVVEASYRWAVGGLPEGDE